MEIWTVAIHHIQTNTFFNIKPIDSFGQIYLEAQPFYAPYNTWSAPTPHNLFLTLWISGGFITVLSFCLLCSRWLYITFHFYKKTKNATILFYIAAFLIILLSGIFDTPFWKNDLSMLFWIIIILGINSYPST
jgi:O-antigen ligase